MARAGLSEEPGPHPTISRLRMSGASAAQRLERLLSQHSSRAVTVGAEKSNDAMTRNACLETILRKPFGFEKTASGADP